jgi:hypothetical protein
MPRRRSARTFDCCIPRAFPTRPTRCRSRRRCSCIASRPVRKPLCTMPSPHSARTPGPCIGSPHPTCRHCRTSAGRRCPSTERCLACTFRCTRPRSRWSWCKRSERSTCPSRCMSRPRQRRRRRSSTAWREACTSPRTPRRCTPGPCMSRRASSRQGPGRSSPRSHCCRKRWRPGFAPCTEDRWTRMFLESYRACCRNSGRSGT